MNRQRFLTWRHALKASPWSTRLTCDPQPGRSPWLRMLRGNRLLWGLLERFRWPFLNVVRPLPTFSASACPSFHSSIEDGLWTKTVGSSYVAHHLNFLFFVVVTYVWRAVFTFIHWIEDISNWSAHIRNWIGDISNAIEDICNWIALQMNWRYLQIGLFGDICNSIADIFNWIGDISNSIADMCTSIGDIFNSVNKCENGAPYIWDYGRSDDLANFPVCDVIDV